MTKRKRITSKMRIEVFERHKGVCHLCSMKVVAGAEWDLSHLIPLAAGGADDESNWLVAHRSCHRVHTATVDIPLVAKVARIRAKHIGAKARSKNPLPGSRASGFKRKMDGTIVPRGGKR